MVGSGGKVKYLYPVTQSSTKEVFNHGRHTVSILAPFIHSHFISARGVLCGDSWSNLMIQTRKLVQNLEKNLSPSLVFFAFQFDDEALTSDGSETE